MSVALPSPHQGCKRFLDREELQDQSEDLALGDFHPHKRAKHLTSPSGRCGSAQLLYHPAYTVGATTFAALRSLFPQMSDKVRVVSISKTALSCSCSVYPCFPKHSVSARNESSCCTALLHLQVIADTLAEFGDDIDAAIKHLNELQLSTPGTSKQHAQQEHQRQGILGVVSLESTPVPDDGEGQSIANDARSPGNKYSTALESSTHAAQQIARTAAEWIDLLVAEMSAARDLPDAKERAARILRAFEQAVMQTSEQHHAELTRENALLKRAVAIQNARLQELGGKVAESAELQAAKERIHALEVQNYSLQVHLRRAADAQGPASMLMTPPKNPDVY